MSRTRIQPYRAGSRSARVLRAALPDSRVIRITNSRYRPREGDLIINWGSSAQRFPDHYYLNTPSACARAADKLESYRVMGEAGVPIPAWTTDIEEAEQWLQEEYTVVSRALTRANSGRGITLHSGWPTELPEVPLYTRYVPKFDEYRVHVAGGQVLDIQQKRRRFEHEDPNYQIRNHANGWVFCRGGVDAPEPVRQVGIDAVESLGLDFGAADVGWTRNTERATVYEVNTAPGLEGTTLERYVEWLKEVRSSY